MHSEALRKHKVGGQWVAHTTPRAVHMCHAITGNRVTFRRHTTKHVYFIEGGGRAPVSCLLSPAVALLHALQIGSQVNFVGQGMVRVQVDPDLRVKGVTLPLVLAVILSICFHAVVAPLSNMGSAIADIADIHLSFCPPLDTAWMSRRLQVSRASSWLMIKTLMMVCQWIFNFFCFFLMMLE